MKELCIAAASLSASLSIRAQGTFICDQQSADESYYLEGSIGLGQQPLGQSFTPSFDSVGFVRIYASGGSSATFLMNIRSDSITGTIIGTSDPLTVGLGGASTFLFSTPVSVTPGTTYYFQPIIQSSVGGYAAFIRAYNYSGGMFIANGLEVPTKDFWFREGIVVPEPSSISLLLLGSGALFWMRKLRRC